MFLLAPSCAQLPCLIGKECNTLVTQLDCSDLNNNVLDLMVCFWNELCSKIKTHRPNTAGVGSPTINCALSHLRSNKLCYYKSLAVLLTMLAPTPKGRRFLECLLAIKHCPAKYFMGKMIMNGTQNVASDPRWAKIKGNTVMPRGVTSFLRVEKEKYVVVLTHKHISRIAFEGSVDMQFFSSLTSESHHPSCAFPGFWHL